MWLCDEELYHYGVKGMKWGVKKERRYLKRHLHSYGAEQNKVVSKWNSDRSKQHIFPRAIQMRQNGRDDEAVKLINDFNDRYRDMMVDAWMKDNRVQNLTEAGKEYLRKKLIYTAK